MRVFRVHVLTIVIYYELPYMMVKNSVSGVPRPVYSTHWSVRVHKCIKRCAKINKTLTFFERSWMQTKRHCCLYAERETRGRRNVLWLMTIHPPNKGWMRLNSLMVQKLNSSLFMICQDFPNMRTDAPDCFLYIHHFLYILRLHSLRLFILYTERREDVH